MYSGSYYNTCRCWDLKTYNNVFTFQHEYYVTCLEIYGLLLFTGSNKVICCDLKSGNKIHLFQPVHKSQWLLTYCGLLFSSNFEITYCWDVETGYLLKRFPGSFASIQIVDSNLYISNENSVKCFSIQNCECIAKYAIGKSQIYHFQIAYGNLYTCTFFEPISCWDLKTGACLKIFNLSSLSELNFIVEFQIIEDLVIALIDRHRITCWEISQKPAHIFLWQ